MRHHHKRFLILAILLALGSQSRAAHAATDDGASHAAQDAHAAATAGYEGYAAGQYKAAARQARRAVRLAPQRRDYWLLLAQALLADGRAEDAVHAVRSAAVVAGDDAALERVRLDVRQARLQAAGAALYAALAAGDGAAAIASGRRAVDLAPAQPAYRLALLYALVRERRDEEAEALAAETLASMPADPATLVLRAYARVARGAVADALADLDLAVDQRAPTAPAARAVRLVAADLALAANEPQHALQMLARPSRPDGDVAARREWAAQVAAAPQTAPAPARLPGIDCTGVASGGTCLLEAAAPPPLPGFAHAAAAYAAMQRGDHAAALQLARLACAESPAKREWRVLHMRAALASGERAEAEAAAAASLALATTADGELSVQDRLDVAYAMVRLGDDQGAALAFAQVDDAGALAPANLADAGYVAMRAGQDGRAVALLGRTLAAAQSGQITLSPQQASELRQTSSEVARTWGLFGSVTNRNGPGVQPGFGPVDGPGEQRVTQAGVEAYWRPWGYRGGAPAEVFARGYGTLDAPTDVPTGSDSFQGGVGARWKPLREHNLVFSISRVFGPRVDDAWLAQVGYSFELGTAPRLDAASWWSTRLQAEAGRFIGHGRHDSYGLASATLGRSFAVADDATVVEPHVFIGAEHRSDAPVARTASGAGVGLSVRRWFRGDATQGPRSSIELTVQYRTRISGDDRMKGPYVTAVLSF